MFTTVLGRMRRWVDRLHSCTITFNPAEACTEQTATTSASFHCRSLLHVMPSASTWVRGQGSATERKSLRTMYRECARLTSESLHRVGPRYLRRWSVAEASPSNAAKAAASPAHSRFNPQHAYTQHAPKKRSFAASGTWKPVDSPALPIKRRKPASTDTKKSKGTNSQPPKTSAKCKEDGEAEKLRKLMDKNAKRWKQSNGGGSISKRSNV